MRTPTMLFRPLRDPADSTRVHAVTQNWEGTAMADSINFCGLLPERPDRNTAVVLAGNMARDVVLGAVGVIPNVGGIPISSLAKGLVTLFWHSDVDIWGMLSQHIESLVHK